MEKTKKLKPSKEEGNRYRNEKRKQERMNDEEIGTNIRKKGKKQRERKNSENKE